MGDIRVDTAGFRRTHPGEPDSHEMALWTFHIQERDVNFWGRYPVAEETARHFARKHGLEGGVITLVDSCGHTRGFVPH